MNCAEIDHLPNAVRKRFLKGDVNPGQTAYVTARHETPGPTPIRLNYSACWQSGTSSGQTDRSVAQQGPGVVVDDLQKSSIPSGVTLGPGTKIHSIQAPVNYDLLRPAPNCSWRRLGRKITSRISSQIWVSGVLSEGFFAVFDSGNLYEKIVLINFENGAVGGS